MQYQIPQFIEVEDRIVGPLTLRQTLYMGGAVAFSLLLYFSSPTAVWITMDPIILAVGAAFALVKVNGKPIPKVLLEALHFYWQPQSYMWQPDNQHLVKNPDTLKQVVAPGFSLENIISGHALKQAWQFVQTGNKEPETVKLSTTRYTIFRQASGDRAAAKRVDYSE